jgi:hypothetical protein
VARPEGRQPTQGSLTVDLNSMLAVPDETAIDEPSLPKFVAIGTIAINGKTTTLYVRAEDAADYLRDQA